MKPIEPTQHRWELPDKSHVKIMVEINEGHHYSLATLDTVTVENAEDWATKNDIQPYSAIHVTPTDSEIIAVADTYEEITEQARSYVDDRTKITARVHSKVRGGEIIEETEDGVKAVFYCPERIEVTLSEDEYVLSKHYELGMV